MLKAFFMTLAVSMLPVIELRGGIPFGVAAGLSYAEAFTAAVIGNMLPTPFVILFIRKIFAFLRRHVARLGRLIDALEFRAESKADIVRRYALAGLIIVVAIPLPGTGAWTGSLIAALMDIRMNRSLPAIFIGVLIAGAVITAACAGAVHIFGL